MNTITVYPTGITLDPVPTILPIYINPKRDKVLITGSNGNLGKKCIQVAQERGFIIYAIHNSLQVDLTNPFATDDYVRTLKPIDLVIMSHGFQYPMLLSDMGNQKYEKWQKVIEANLSSCAYLTSSLIYHNKINHGGMIVYISSIQASHPREGRSAYAAAKAGLEALMRAVAQEIKPIKARAIALRLGQLSETMRGISFTETQLQKIGENMPLGLISPNKVAELIFDLYKNPYLTGEVIHLDSGHSLQIWK